MNKACWYGVLVGLLMTSGLARADAGLDADLAELKADVAALNSALFQLEEDILYPADSQLGVFLSLDSDSSFQLDSVELAVNGRKTGAHLYTDQQRDALQQGGVQRLYLGNLPQGKHRITATLNGRGSNDRYFRKQQSFSVTKEGEAERVELVVRTDAPNFSPEFALKRWQ